MNLKFFLDLLFTSIQEVHKIALKGDELDLLRNIIHATCRKLSYCLREEKKIVCDYTCLKQLGGALSRRLELYYVSPF